MYINKQRFKEFVSTGLYLCYGINDFIFEFQCKRFEHLRNEIT